MACTALILFPCCVFAGRKRAAGSFAEGVQSPAKARRRYAAASTDLLLLTCSLSSITGRAGDGDVAVARGLSSVQEEEEKEEEPVAAGAGAAAGSDDDDDRESSGLGGLGRFFGSSKAKQPASAVVAAAMDTSR
jgi:hypothetical protein